MDCKQGWNGNCCCNCTHHLPLMKHPWNKGEGKGSISEQFGYACTGFLSEGENLAIYYDMSHKHGMCEMHNRKKEQVYSGGHPDMKEI